jgi:hypothetical protein
LQSELVDYDIPKVLNNSVNSEIYDKPAKSTVTQLYDTPKSPFPSFPSFGATAKHTGRFIRIESKI